MERQILLVYAGEIHSKKTGEDYYVIEYVDKKAQRNKSSIKNVLDYPKEKYLKILEKTKKGITEQTAIYEINEYDRAEFIDIK